MNKNKCDICGSIKNITAGRWIFYCPKHKSKDWEMTYENEIERDLKNGDMDYLLNDGELAEMFLDNI